MCTILGCRVESTRYVRLQQNGSLHHFTVTTSLIDIGHSSGTLDVNIADNQDLAALLSSSAIFSRRLLRNLHVIKVNANNLP